MVGVPESGSWAPAAAGERGRTGGVPNRGGEVPNELESAAARAEIPGPAGCDAGPGSGNNGLDSFSSAAAGVGACACCDGGGTPKPFEGTGDARRAMDSWRGTEAEMDRAREEPWGDPTGMSRPGAGEFLPEVAMATAVLCALVLILLYHAKLIMCVRSSGPRAGESAGRDGAMFSGQELVATRFWVLIGSR